jgi:hypothetical protein
MKEHMNFKLIPWVVKGTCIGAMVLAGGCSKSETTAAATGSGTFPDFYTLTKQAVPSVSSSSTISAALTREANHEKENVSFDHFQNFLTLPSSYSTTASDFTTAFDTNQNFIGQVLNDPGPSGPVKSMYVLLNQAQSTMTTINTYFSDSSGNPTNCTAIASTKNLTTPFFSTATNTPMVTWTDAGKYTCYAAESSMVLAFGRQAITSPTTGCTDAYEYYVMTGYGRQDEANTEQVATRGSTVSISSIQKFYYNGCTTDLKLIYAQSTKYSAGVEFSSRTELSGNTTDHTFKIRTNYIDADTTYATHISIAGQGTSQKKASGDATVNFVMGYRTDNCGTSSNSSSCSLGTPLSFCVKNTGTTNSYTLDSTTSNCSSYTTEYTAITTLDRSDLPNGYFEVSTTSLGL